MNKLKPFSIILMFFVTPTFGAANTWIDKQGNVHYSDEKTEQIKLPKQAPKASAEIEKADQNKANRQENINVFIAEIANRLRPRYNFHAKSTQEAEELYRWGEGICTNLKEGRTEQQLIEGNMDQFFGPDLGAAIVEAAHKVICPEIK